MWMVTYVQGVFGTSSGVSAVIVTAVVGFCGTVVVGGAVAGIVIATRPPNPTGKILDHF